MKKYSTLLIISTLAACSFSIPVQADAQVRAKQVVNAQSMESRNSMSMDSGSSSRPSLSNTQSMSDRPTNNNSSRPQNARNSSQSQESSQNSNNQNSRNSSTRPSRNSSHNNENRSSSSTPSSENTQRPQRELKDGEYAVNIIAQGDTATTFSIDERLTSGSQTDENNEFKFWIVPQNDKVKDLKPEDISFGRQIEIRERSGSNQNIRPLEPLPQGTDYILEKEGEAFLVTIIGDIETVSDSRQNEETGDSVESNSNESYTRFLSYSFGIDRNDLKEEDFIVASKDPRFVDENSDNNNSEGNSNNEEVVLGSSNSEDNGSRSQGSRNNREDDNNRSNRSNRNHRNHRKSHNKKDHLVDKILSMDVFEGFFDTKGTGTFTKNGGIAVATSR